MLILTCPYCGVLADETDLHGGGEAHLVRASVGSDDVDFEKYLFSRANPIGVHFERWRHVYGCGKWFLAARNTATLQVYGTYKSQMKKPPKAIENAIKKSIPNWEGWS